MKTSTLLLLALAFALIPVLSAPAAFDSPPPAEPAEIVKDTMADVVQILENSRYTELRKKQKLEPEDIELREKFRQQIRELLIARLDIGKVADLTLASEKGKFSANQRKRFEDLFADLLFSTYIQHLEKYTGESLEITATKKVSPNPKDSRFWVQSVARSNGRETPIDYCMYQAGDAWKLYDVRIEGLSLVQNYRGQFREILVKEKTGQPLIERIEKRLEEIRQGEAEGAES